VFAAGACFTLPYDPTFLTRRFKKVFHVDRAFALEFAAVWKATPNQRPTERRP
jgi:hypothetical protein